MRVPGDVPRSWLVWLLPQVRHAHRLEVLVSFCTPWCASKVVKNGGADGTGVLRARFVEDSLLS